MGAVVPPPEEAAAQPREAASASAAAAPVVRHLGRRPYAGVHEAMRRFTEERGPEAADEIWLVEHEPVYTLGLNASRAHLLAPAGEIPVVTTDRGGQVTYHGPGQAVLYPLLQLRRHGLGVRDLVTLLEASVVEVLRDFGIEGAADPAAPGVYVDRRKIASVGLRIRRGCSYHGVSLNVTGDLTPFSRINPCGYRGLQMTHMVGEGAPASLTVTTAGDLLARAVNRRLA